MTNLGLYQATEQMKSVEEIKEAFNDLNLILYLKNYLKNCFNK